MIWFDWNAYFQLQKETILERIHKFKNRLYLEIWGKFMMDGHASRVLLGFDPETKRKLFQDLAPISQILFNVNYQDIISNRQLSNDDIDYTPYIQKMLLQIEQNIWIKPLIVINRCNHEEDPLLQQFITTLSDYKCFKRYEISWYPSNTDLILSPEGYGKDEYIPLEKNLILVSGAASNSWKMSTCLGQIYLDSLKWIESWYAKYETFPIRNLPLHHPINLAYEAATVDIGDYNCIDTYHQKSYGIDSVNYNRDVDAFEIVTNVGKKFLPTDNFVRTYQSPTDMGINKAGFAITNDEVCSIASLREIERRKQRYQEIIDRWEGDNKRIRMCDNIMEKCITYIKEKKYNQHLDLEKTL